jgi:hypothetical protein
MKDEYVARWARPEEFCEIIVTPKMIFEHLPAQLSRAFSALIAGAESVATDSSPSLSPVDVEPMDDCIVVV